MAERTSPSFFRYGISASLPVWCHMTVPQVATPASPKPLQEIFPAGVKLRDPEDNHALRQSIFDSVKHEMTRVFPQEFGGVRVELKDVDYDGPDTVSKKEQGRALMENRYLARRLRGRLELYDSTTGELLDQKHMTLARVPYLTERGTYIHGGSEYAPINQLRLVPGPYTRIQNNGILETQFNTKPGTGARFRTALEPESGQFRFRVKNSDLHLYSLLRELGVDDKRIESSWGAEILQANRAKYDARTLDKAYLQFVPRRLQDPAADAEKKRQALRDAFDAAQVRRDVLGVNLPDEPSVKKAASEPPAAPAARSFYTGINWAVKSASFTADEMQTLAIFLNTQLNAGLDPNMPSTQLKDHIMDFVLGSTTGGSQALLAASQAAQVPSPYAPDTDNPDLTKYAKAMVIVGLCRNHPDEFSINGSGDMRTITHTSGRSITISNQDFIPGELI